VKLNLGCGRDVRDDYINVDQFPHAGAVQADIYKLPFPDDSVDELIAYHLLEHLLFPLEFMAEAWRVAKPDARIEVRTPHGASDDAWADPTHVRPIFGDSFGYFGQPYYWKADYGYRADWRLDRIEHVVTEGQLARLRARDPKLGVESVVDGQRNIITELRAHLTAIKPARPAERTAQKVEIELLVAG
jgi:SAM-dependent methyltransferase